jgi:hypothetical protein
MNETPKQSEPRCTEPTVAETIPDWHREELARRRAAAEADPERSLPWEEVRQRLMGAHTPDPGADSE